MAKLRIPDCYDAVAQEWHRQTDFDQRCEAAPRCAQCGGSLYPYETYTALGSVLYCEECVKSNTHDVERLEVFM